MRAERGIVTSTPSHLGPSPFVQSYFDPAHRATFFVLPGDGFAIAEYQPFAEDVFRAGGNVHLVDYVGGAADASTNGDIDHALCVAATLRALTEIDGHFFTAADHARFLVGHSRGAYIALGVLERPDDFQGRALLYAPYLGPAFATKPPLALALGIGLKILLRRPLRLTYQSFRNRFFAAHTPESAVRALYARSPGLCRGLLLDRTQLPLAGLRREGVTVYAYTEDHAMPTDVLEANLARACGGAPTAIRIVRVPGAHCEMLVESHLSARRMVEEWLP